MDPHEVNKFETMASRWWDPEGEFKPLHLINPIRLQYIESSSKSLSDKTILDIGCGGGLLSESMALKGSTVTGIDAGEAPLNVARLHAMRHQDLKLTYTCSTAEQYMQQHPATFDIVTCMEMLEHVPDPASVIQSCSELVKTGGDVYFSTLNRTPKAYMTSILCAEYILNMLPKGTHDYARFIRPSELCGWVREAGLDVVDIKGINYQPLNQTFILGNNTLVNYLLHARRQ